MKYFTIEELTYSEKAKTKRMENVYTHNILDNINELVDNILDPLRESWSEYCKQNELGTGAIKVTSGYRCPLINKLVGGSSTSAHLSGYAADIVPVNKQMKVFQRFVEDWIKDRDFDQLIFEKPINGVASWLHIGYKNRNGEQRKQIFTLV